MWIRTFQGYKRIHTVSSRLVKQLRRVCAYHGEEVGSTSIGVVSAPSTVGRSPSAVVGETRDGRGRWVPLRGSETSAWGGDGVAEAIGERLCLWFFLERAEALKWPHLGQRYSMQKKGTKDWFTEGQIHEKGNIRASSHMLSLTKPLWLKHFSHINAYRELGDEIVGSSSPSSASANLSYHCFRGGATGNPGVAASRTVIGDQQRGS